MAEIPVGAVALCLGHLTAMGCSQVWPLQRAGLLPAAMPGPGTRGTALPVGWEERG